MKHELPPLPYPVDALEPFFDAKTMEIHHGKHHKTYVDKLNAALEKHPALQAKSARDLLLGLASVPDDVKGAVRNHGGGHYNHSLFWPTLKKGVQPKGSVVDAIAKQWGSMDSFQKAFGDAATGVFGSGWAWLALNKGKLEITTTPNQDSPLSLGKEPVFGLDVWEHAYYLRHTYNRAAYVQDFWNVVNWDQVEKNYKDALKR